MDSKVNNINSEKGAFHKRINFLEEHIKSSYHA